jgi:ribonuclease J
VTGSEKRGKNVVKETNKTSSAKSTRTTRQNRYSAKNHSGKKIGTGAESAPVKNPTELRNPSDMTIEERLRALRMQSVQETVEIAVEPKPVESGKTAGFNHGKTVRRQTVKSKASAEKTAKKPTTEKPKKTSSGTSKSGRGKVVRKTPVRLIPLGGLHEIGKNMTVYECCQDMFIVDCGLAFPDADMLGVDLVIPDFSFLEKNADRIRGIVITHGHEDHIGAIPYLLKKINVPIYGTKLVIGLIEGKLKEHGLLGKAQLNIIKPKQTVKMGCMAVEFIRVNHSIPDCVGIAVHTPAGVIIYTGDFKVDFSPIEGDIIDLARFAELGNKGVLCLLSDSTNAEKAGSTMSESKVGQSFNLLFNQAEGKRIIVATFASNIHRIQQIVDNAVKYGRKVAVSGRSMINVVGIAVELGYLNIPDGVLIDIDAINRYPADQIVLITTGSQGEPLSALARMASSDHRKVSVTSNDYIIISATPIPGNEKHVTRVVNDLLKLGAEVIYEKMYEVHVSGHACQDELKLMLSLTKPRYFIPFHGEYKHLKAHARLAQETGMEPSHILVGDIGQVIEMDNVDMKVVDTVPAGGVFVDGLGVGDVGSIVIRDRKHLAQDGLIIVVAAIENETGACVSGPDIVSRGFVYVRESEELMEEARKVVKQALDECIDNHIRDWTTMKLNIKDALSSFIYRKTKRSPMILPIIMEI